MAFKKINQVSFMADFVSDLQNLPISPMGSECYVIENACEYKCNSNNEWINQNKIIGNGYSKEEIDEKLIKLKEEILASLQ